MLAMQVRRADFDELHRHLTREEARERRLQLRVGEEEDAFASERRAPLVQRRRRAGAPRRRGGFEFLSRDAESVGDRAKPSRRPFLAQREAGVDTLGAALFERARRIAQEGVSEKKRRVGADRGKIGGAAHGEETRRRDSQHIEEAGELVFHDVGERADDEQRSLRVCRLLRQTRGERGEAHVLALSEGGFDPASRIAQDADAGAVSAREPGRRSAQIDLDDFRGAGADEEQQLDVRTPLEQPRDDAVDLVVDVGHAREIALLQDGRGEARLGENHHAGGGLNEMGAGARSDDKEEGVLDFAMQPNNAG